MTAGYIADTEARRTATEGTPLHEPFSVTSGVKEGGSGRRHGKASAHVEEA